MDQVEDDDRGVIHYGKFVLSLGGILIETIRTTAILLLVIWHIYLSRIGITTYQFLVEKEELEKLKLSYDLK